MKFIRTHKMSVFLGLLLVVAVAVIAILGVALRSSDAALAKSKAQVATSQSEVTQLRAALSKKDQEIAQVTLGDLGLANLWKDVFEQHSRVLAVAYAAVAPPSKFVTVYYNDTVRAKIGMDDGSVTVHTFWPMNSAMGWHVSSFGTATLVDK